MEKEVPCSNHTIGMTGQNTESVWIGENRCAGKDQRTRRNDSLVRHACNPNTRRREAGGLQFPRQPGLHRKALSPDPKGGGRETKRIVLTPKRAL